MSIWKKCCINAEGCELQYDMELRKEAIKYEVFGDSPPYYERCENPACQAWSILKDNPKRKKKK